MSGGELGTGGEDMCVRAKSCRDDWRRQYLRSLLSDRSGGARSSFMARSGEVPLAWRRHEGGAKPAAVESGTRTPVSTMRGCGCIRSFCHRCISEQGYWIFRVNGSV